MIDPQPPRAWTSDCLVIGDTWSGCGWEPAHPDLACLDSRPSSDRCKAFALQLVLSRPTTFVQYWPLPATLRCVVPTRPGHHGYEESIIYARWFVPPLDIDLPPRPARAHVRPPRDRGAAPRLLLVQPAHPRRLGRPAGRAGAAGHAPAPVCPRRPRRAPPGRRDAPPRAAARARPPV